MRNDCHCVGSVCLCMCLARITISRKDQQESTPPQACRSEMNDDGQSCVIKERINQKFRLYLLPQHNR